MRPLAGPALLSGGGVFTSSGCSSSRWRALARSPPRCRRRRLLERPEGWPKRSLEALLEKATQVEGALAVERELERVTQSIEQLKGKLRLLEELPCPSSGSSTIQIIEIGGTRELVTKHAAEVEFAAANFEVN